MEPNSEKELVIEPNFIETPLESNIVSAPNGSVMKGGAMQSPNFSKGIAGWKIDSAGNAEFNNAEIRGTIVIGGQYRTVAVGDSIQSAIDAVYAAGGGTVVLQNGTHTLTANLNLYSYVTLQGQTGHGAILDFVNNAYGIVASGSSAYSTGTVSISNNGTALTGSGTSWATNVVAGMYILLGGIWYPITVVGSDTSITIGVPYAGVALSGAVYVAAVPIDSIEVNKVTIKNASTALAITYCSRAIFNDVNVNSSVTGITTTDSSLLTFNVATLTANNAGGSFTRTHYTQFVGCSSIDALAGVGFTLTTCTNFVFQNSFSLNSSGDGFNVTSCSNANFDACSVIENGGQGIEFISGNSDISISGGAYENNASDGIKLTATTDNLQIIGNSIKDNGGYGLNIAASTDDNNVITSNNFSGNSTSAVNDSGTGTVIRGNVGVTDNSTSSLVLSSITDTLTAGEDIATGDAVSIGDGVEYIQSSLGADTTTETIRDTAWYSQSFTTSAGAKKISAVSLKFSNSLGDPQTVSNVTVHIYANSGGAPTGSSLGSQAFSGNSGSVVKTTFATPVTVTASTVYHIVIQSTTGDNNTNIRRANSAGQGTNKSTDSGSNWAANNGAIYCTIYEIDSVVGQIMKSTAVGPTRARDKNFIGFASSSITSGSSGSVVVSGSLTTSGLTAGMLYYLSDTRGAISSSAGSVTRKIGISLTTTKLLITNIW